MSSKFEFNTCHPQLSEALQARCLERAIRDVNVRGYLLIHEMQGQGLAIKDKIIRSSDPYVKLYCEQTPSATPEEIVTFSSTPQFIKSSSSRSIWKSSVVKKNLNPVWTELNVKLGPLAKTSSIKVDLWDRDAILNDDYMGSCNFSSLVVDLLQEEAKSNRITLTFVLSSRTKGEVKGTLSLTVSWIDEADAKDSSSPSSSSYLTIPITNTPPSTSPRSLSSSPGVARAASQGALPESIPEAKVSETAEEDEQLYRESPLPTSPPTLTIGFDSTKGKRPTMEDTHVIFPNLRENFPTQFASDRWNNSGEPVSFFGVYDGHGGKEAAEKTAAYLHKTFVESEAFSKGDIEAAWKFAFEETDRLIIADSQKEKWMSGAVVVAAALIGSRLHVANLGDSELVIGRNYTPLKEQGSKVTRPSSKYRGIAVAHKHKPTDPDEKERITKAGAFVHQGRVCGTLAVSRALGDPVFKPPISDLYVSNEPFIATPIDLRPQDRFIVLGCDGLFDRLQYDEIVNLVAMERQVNGANPTEVCRALVKEATRKDSTDNITVIVVFFNWDSTP